METTRLKCIDRRKFEEYLYFAETVIAHLLPVTDIRFDYPSQNRCNHIRWWQSTVRKRWQLQGAFCLDRWHTRGRNLCCSKMYPPSGKCWKLGFWRELAKCGRASSWMMNCWIGLHFSECHCSLLIDSFKVTANHDCSAKETSLCSK